MSPVLTGFPLQSIFLRVVAQTVQRALLNAHRHRPITYKFIIKCTAKCFVRDICAVCYQWRKVVRGDGKALMRAVVKTVLRSNGVFGYRWPLQTLATVGVDHLADIFIDNLQPHEYMATSAAGVPIKRFPIGSILFAKGRAYRIDYQRYHLYAHFVALRCPGANCAATVDKHTLVFGAKQILATSLVPAADIQAYSDDNDLFRAPRRTNDPAVGLGLQPYAMAIDTDHADTEHLYVCDRIHQEAVVVRKLRLDNGCLDAGFMMRNLLFQDPGDDDWMCYLRVCGNRVLCEIRCQYLDVDRCYLWLLDSASGCVVYCRVCECPEDMHFALSSGTLLLYKTYDGGYCGRSNVCFVVRRVLLTDLVISRAIGSDDNPFFFLVGLGDRCRKADDTVISNNGLWSLDRRWNIFVQNVQRAKPCNLCNKYNESAKSATYTAWTHCDCRRGRKRCICCYLQNHRSPVPAISKSEKAAVARATARANALVALPKLALDGAAARFRHQRCVQCSSLHRIRATATTLYDRSYLCRRCQQKGARLPHHGNSPFQSFYRLNSNIFLVATNRGNADAQLRVVDVEKNLCVSLANGLVGATRVPNVGGYGYHRLYDNAIRSYHRWCNAFDYQNHTVCVRKPINFGHESLTFSLLPKQC